MTLPLSAHTFQKQTVNYVGSGVSRNSVSKILDKQNCVSKAEYAKAVALIIKLVFDCMKANKSGLCFVEWRLIKNRCVS